MRKTAMLALFGALLLSSRTRAQQGNAHTYRASLARQPRTDMDRANYVRSFVDSVMNVVHRNGTTTGMPADFHYRVSQWAQQDVTEFAACSNTFDTYEILLGIANAAVAKDGNGQWTPNALAAQAALEHIKPAGCNSWKGFYNMIANAAEATQSKRDGFRKAQKI